MEAVIYLRQWLHAKGLTLLPTAKDKDGYDAFWYAGTNEKIKQALAAPIEQLSPSLLEEKEINHAARTFSKRLN